jgi:hypothetical protein
MDVVNGGRLFYRTVLPGEAFSVTRPTDGAHGTFCTVKIVAISTSNPYKQTLNTSFCVIIIMHDVSSSNTTVWQDMTFIHPSSSSSTMAATAADRSQILLYSTVVGVVGKDSRHGNDQ